MSPGCEDGTDRSARCDAAHGNAHHHRGEPQPAVLAQLSRTITPRVPAPSAICSCWRNPRPFPPHQLMTAPVDDADLDQADADQRNHAAGNDGSKIFFSGSIKRLTITGTRAATKLTPNSIAIISCGPPPCALPTSLRPPSRRGRQNWCPACRSSRRRCPIPDWTAEKCRCPRPAATY